MKISKHPNIIRFYGVTKLKGNKNNAIMWHVITQTKYLKRIIYYLDEKNYSLVLEYADGGTLGEYLESNATTFGWESKLKFAKEISSAILCLYDNKIVHRDLVSLID